jgi:hypothetical protein
MDLLSGWVMWNLVSVHLETVLVTLQYRYPRTIGSKIILEAPAILLGDEAQVEAGLSPFGDSANLDARNVHGLCRTYHWLGNHIGRTRWNS